MTDDAGAARPDGVRVERRTGWAEVVLDRPHHRNALTQPMVARAGELLDELAADAAVSAVLLRGAEGTFCAGLDLKESADPARPFGATWAALHLQLADYPKPIIGALERAAIAAGAALALSCDLLWVGAAAVLHVSELQLGLPAPANAAWLTARLGDRRALGLLFDSRPLVGQAIVDLGLAHAAVPEGDVLDTARRSAARIASFDADTVRTTKAAVRSLGRDGSFSALRRMTASGTAP